MRTPHVAEFEWQNGMHAESKNWITSAVLPSVLKVEGFCETLFQCVYLAPADNNNDVVSQHKCEFEGHSELYSV